MPSTTIINTAFNNRNSNSKVFSSAKLPNEKSVFENFQAPSIKNLLNNFDKNCEQVYNYERWSGREDSFTESVNLIVLYIYMYI